MTVRDIVLSAAGVGGSTPPPTSSDPQFPYVSLLLNDTGTNGQQNNTFIDSSSNAFTITRNGTPTQGSFTPYWPNGQWSNYFNGTTDYLTTPSSTALDFGTGSFTIEMWVFATSASNTQQNIIATADTAWGAGAIRFGRDSVYGTFALNGNSQGMLLRDPTALTIGVWTHYAIVRSGSSMALFRNGTRVATTTSSASITFSNGKGCAIGHTWDGSGSFWQGYISNVRIVNGTAVYDPTQTSVTVPTTPLTAVSGTSLLTCQSNRFKDNSSNNFAITVNGTPTVQTLEPFEPSASYTTTYGGSGYFNGTTDYLTTSSSTSLALGTSDFTLECWYYAFAKTTTYPVVVQNAPFASNAWQIADRNGALTVFSFFAYNINSGAPIMSSTTPVRIGAWQHIAVTRSGNTFYLFVNGNLEGTATSSLAIDTGAAGTLNIGGSSAGTTDANAYISNFRMVKGTALYTSNFTPPTSPVTAVSGTSLLLNATNAGVYDASTNNDLSTLGNAQVSTTQYKYGSSSLSFNGTATTNISIPDKPQLQFGTGDWTVEFFIYFNSLPSAVQDIVGKGAAGTGWAVGLNASNIFRVRITNAGAAGGSAVTTGVWYHIAVVCTSGTVKLYKDGVLQLTHPTTGTNFNQTNPFFIGYISGTAYFNGYIDELRVTNGIARYTANFTPPIAAFPTR